MIFESIEASYLWGKGGRIGNEFKYEDYEGYLADWEFKNFNRITPVPGYLIAYPSVTRARDIWYKKITEWGR